MTRVYVGMSGGVDSSLTAALLVEQGYDVTGVYMKNWTQDLPGMKCPWADDMADAKRVAVQLGIDFKVFDFEKEYKQKVVDYMIDEYKNGRTPNPDVMCNQEVKFKLFLNTALEDGADMIATGHYAQIEYRILNIEYGREQAARFDSNQDTLEPKSELTPGLNSDLERSSVLVETDRKGYKKIATLKRAVDDNKDQTYFLYRVSSEALSKTLFPLGEFTKPEVRKMAEERGLYTAGKKDSQGICFVGKVGIRDFLSQYVEQKPGQIIDKKSGKVLGQHDGAIFYTLGQRHGLDVGGGLPYYIVGKDMEKNEVYVTTDLNDGGLWRTDVELQSVHWIGRIPESGTYDIRIRHRAPLVKAKLTIANGGASVQIKILDQQRAIATGQSIVIYDGDECLGGGIVS